MAIEKYVTLVDRLGFSKGTPVTLDRSKDIKGKTGMLLVNMPGSGGLFYKEEELEAVKQ